MMQLTLRKSQSLGDVYLLTLCRTIEYKTNTTDVEPIDIIKFLEDHYKGKYTECENHEFQEIDDKKLHRYIQDIKDEATDDKNGLQTYRSFYTNENFYRNLEIISVLIKLDEEEEKAFIPSLKLYLSDKKLTYNVDS
jgi:hypothetical protein